MELLKNQSTESVINEFRASLVKIAGILVDAAGTFGDQVRIKPAAPLLACVIRRGFFCLEMMAPPKWLATFR